MPDSEPRAVILMGVAGSGKSTVGVSLAKRLGCPFLDADAFHPSANVEKMKRSIPLNDEDRLGKRKDHFFPKELLESQFAALERPADAIVVDARLPLEDVVEQIVSALKSPPL